MPAHARGKDLTEGTFDSQCALTKLSYLLSKPELSAEAVRNLVGAPLRGELTSIPRGTRTPAIDANLETIGNTLSHVVRLTTPARHPTPAIVVSDAEDGVPDAAAPWTWTAAEVATTQGALLSWLVHLAAAANDVDVLSHCLSNGEENAEDQRTIVGGIVNWINPASGRSPLHVAAINGSTHCVHALLKAGSLVHLRDSLSHTALYYVSDSTLPYHYVRKPDRRWVGCAARP
jgi:lysophospholipase